MPPALEIKNLCSGYGPVRVLKDICLSVPQGKIVSVIGANGAGKTTLLMTICGVVRVGGGEILWEGKSITRCATDEIVRDGIVQVPEGRRVFTHLTVAENLQLGAFSAPPGTDIAAEMEKVYSIFPLLAQRRRQLAGTLSGGEQQMLAIGRGLMARPRLLLLDEPSLGLAPKMIEIVFEVIKKINEQGVTIVLVEQNAYMALRMSLAGYVLETGRVVLSDSSERLLANPQIRKAYLGQT